MSQPSQADIFAALQSNPSAFRSRPPPQTYLASSFPNPASALTISSGSASGSRPSACKIYCFKESCGSLVLSPGVGEWVDSGVDAFPQSEKSPFPSSTDSTTSEKTLQGYWHVQGSPLCFENIGFSKESDMALPPGAPGADGARGKKVKWLICAECDLGPIGWSYEGGSEAWLGADRVRYGEVAKA